jgi:hypothetical protein
MSSWATSAAVRDAVHVSWSRGDVLRGLHTDAAPPFLRVRLPGPSRDEIATRFAEAAAWARRLREESERAGWRLENKRVKVGGAGVQELPAAAIIDSAEQAVRLLGRDHVRTAGDFATALELATVTDPAARELALRRPHDVIAAKDDWPLLLAVAVWLKANPRPAIHLRQLPLSGVHTKLLETHRTLASRLLDAVLPADSIDPAATALAGRYGFLEPARRARLRGRAALLGLPTPGIGDVTWDVAAVAALDPRPAGVTELLIVENQTAFLVAPAPPYRLVLWGAGYGADELLSALPWLADITVRYWGDIDTHGFAILDRVRAVAPRARSLLMDEATLHAHKAFWVHEPTPRIQPLTWLTSAESAVYQALCEGTYGAQLRLEQELIRFDWVEEALSPG